MNEKTNSNIFNTIITVLTWMCIIILSVGTMAAVAFQVEAISFRYPLDYGEGPLLNQAVQMSAGNPIYLADISQGPYTIANYPPIYVGAMAIFENFFGPAFWYGRLISSLSVIGSSILVILMAYSYSKDWKIALIPGLLLINIPYVVSWSTLARIDHLALFFALLGLFFILKAGKSGNNFSSSFILGSIFLVAAIYTRQSYALAAPLAGFLYLTYINWKKGLILAGVVGGLSLILFFLINLVTRGGFYFNIVTANINPFGFERMTDNFRNFFSHIPVIFILASLGMVLTFNQIDSWPLVIGFTLGGFFSALTIGKIGSNVNYFLELAAGMCLLIGCGLTILKRNANKGLPFILICTSLILLSWQGISMLNIVQDESRAGMDDRKQAYEDFERMEDMVKGNLEKPILADEYMGMVVIAGQSLHLQPFEITQLVNAGIFDQNILIEEIEAEDFSLILLQESSWWEYVLQERWTPEMLDAIRSHYRLAAQFEYTNVYQPRTRQVTVPPEVCPDGTWPLPSRAHMGFRYSQEMLILYGAGVEGQVPVKSPADGEVFRPVSFPIGSLVIVHDDPFNPGERVITLFEDMRSFRGDTVFIADAFPTGSEGVRVNQGDIIGYQAMWSGIENQQDWLHVKIGIAKYDPIFIENYELLRESLVHPADYFGIIIGPDATTIRPLVCSQ